MVSSAVFRYFPTREALLTALIVESYARLAEALDIRLPRQPADRWAELAHTFRGWALDNPHEFQLIYGTPIPGYVAPPETVPAAAAVAGPFIRVGAQQPVAGFAGPVATQLAEIATPLEADPSGAAAVLAELATLVGMVSLELAGHFVGTADPTDDLFDATVERQVRSLGLDAPTVDGRA